MACAAGESSVEKSTDRSAGISAGISASGTAGILAVKNDSRRNNMDLYPNVG